MKPRILLLLLATGLSAMAQTPAKKPAAPPSDLEALLQHPILEKDLPVREAQTYCESRVPRMPKVDTLAGWQSFADQTRRDVLDKVIFRGALAQHWRDAKTKVEWLDTIEGGPGYHIRKLRYEALPGLWIPALLYQPDKVAEKMPVYLAVNGHDGVGKAAGYKQIRCINLAKRGIACLNIEWLGMGQLKTADFAHARLNQLDLCGVSGLAPFYLSMSRAIDILLALRNADPSRLAVSGLSGGGWQTITISSLDTRVKLCNPVAGYSSFRTRAEFPSDLGDSEQTPNDLATVADYTHLTAMLAGRAALLTFNAKDNCCFASDHALQPLLDAAEPIFRLYGQPERLRSHINYDPGTHNYEVDNRQAFYRMVGDIFHPGDASFDAKEIPSDAEVKTRADLDVPLPADNLDLHQLALAAGEGLPHNPGQATREKLRDVVKYKSFEAVATPAGEEARAGIKAVYWKLRMGDAWTVPVVELTRGEAKGTTIVVADTGRATVSKEIEDLLAAGQRVLAVEPFGFGEASMAGRTYLYALLVATVGDRALGIEAGQLNAIAHWATSKFSGVPAVQSIGPRGGVVALVAAAVEPHTFTAGKPAQPLESLHDLLVGNSTVSEKPELFCFGLLESFDVPQLKVLAGPAAAVTSADVKKSGVPVDFTSKAPRFTFADSLAEQEAQLKDNPALAHYREARARHVDVAEAPLYHFSSPEAPLNDPNGLCYWQGRWHLFYQTKPLEDNRWHWAHAVSTDLVHWRDLPLAIYPHPEEQSYSGATFVDGDRVIAMYHGRNLGNMVAVSHDPLLLNWEKVTGTTVIPIAKDGLQHHFLSHEKLPYRIYDACVWKKDGMYYSLSGSVQYNGPAEKPVPAEYLFRSPDLAHWEFVHQFLENDRFTRVGDDGACPYFWPIGDRHILIFFSHTSSAQYLLGDYDRTRDKFVATSHGRFCFGPVLPGAVQAPSACPDGQGGVIAIFNFNPGRTAKDANSIMTLPQHLTLLHRDEIGIEPAGEIASLRRDAQHLDAMALPANHEVVLPTVHGNAMEIDAVIDPKTAPMVELNVLRSPNKEEYTRIALLPQRALTSRFMPPQEKLTVVTLDNTHSSQLPDALSRPPESGSVYIAPDEPIKLRVFVDRSVVEVFVNGRLCVALRVYPGRADSVGVSLSAQGQDAELKSLDAWRMEGIFGATKVGSN